VPDNTRKHFEFLVLKERVCNMFKYVMSFLVLACVMASPVLAGGGGGGGKRNATIRIVHNIPGADLLAAGAGNTSFIIIADPSAALIDRVNGVGGAFATPRDITASGGVIIRVGRTATLSVRAGTVRICGAIVLPNGAVEPVSVDDITVARGGTVTLNADNATPAGAW
jgi:hypothetical protein